MNSIQSQIKVITKLPNSEKSYKGKVKTHNYINRQNQSTTGKLWKPDLVQAFLKKWWVEKIILQFELSFEFWIIFSSWRIVNIWKPLSYVIPTSPILKCTQGQHRPFLYTFYWSGLKLTSDSSSRSYISSVSVSFNVIINKTKVIPPQAYVTLTDLGYPV
jgi:hypothetical protein